MIFGLIGIFATCTSYETTLYLSSIYLTYLESKKITNFRLSPRTGIEGESYSLPLLSMVQEVKGNLPNRIQMMKKKTDGVITLP